MAFPSCAHRLAAAGRGDAVGPRIEMTPRQNPAWSRAVAPDDPDRATTGLVARSGQHGRVSAADETRRHADPHSSGGRLRRCTYVCDQSPGALAVESTRLTRHRGCRHRPVEGVGRRPAEASWVPKLSFDLAMRRVATGKPASVHPVHPPQVGDYQVVPRMGASAANRRHTARIQQVPRELEAIAALLSYPWVGPAGHVVWGEPWRPP
jgi:hypothetical protein